MASLFSRLKPRPFVSAGIIVLAAIGVFYYMEQSHLNSLDGPRPGERSWIPGSARGRYEFEHEDRKNPNYAILGDFSLPELRQECEKMGTICGGG